MTDLERAKILVKMLKYRAYILPMERRRIVEELLMLTRITIRK